MEGQVLWQFIIAGLSSQVFEWVKQWKRVSWITAHSSTLNRWIGAGIAFCVGLGITFHFDSSQHSLLISGLDPAGIWNAGTAMITQWVFQQLILKGVIKPVAPVKGGDK